MADLKDSNLGHAPPKNGTLYSCGCWHDGAPQYHAPRCPTHQNLWKVKYLDGQKLNRDYGPDQEEPGESLEVV